MSSITKYGSNNNVLILEKESDICNILSPLNVTKTTELIDVSSTGKVRPWKGHKRMTSLLSESFKRIGKLNKSERVKECGTQLEFVECFEGHYKKLKRANFCKVRLCPMCGWRRSLKVAHQVKQIAHEAMKVKSLRWLLLTLTMKNVKEDKLSKEVDYYIKSFYKLSRRKKFKNSILGFFRSLEVTYNKEENTYHPHYHVLLAVTPRYFDGRNYIRKSEWTNLWKQVTRLNYEPIVDVRTVKIGRRIEKEKEILTEKGYIESGIISEISKYTIKSGDYLFKDDKNLTDKVVEILESTLKGRRLFAFGGLLKEIYKNLEKEKKIEDVESKKADLIHISDELQTCMCPVCDSTLLEEIYHWLPDQKVYYKISNYL